MASGIGFNWGPFWWGRAFGGGRRRGNLGGETLMHIVLSPLYIAAIVIAAVFIVCWRLVGWIYRTATQ